MEEDRTSVREDQGYSLPNGKEIARYQKPTASEISNVRENLRTRLIRVEYIKGICKGRISTVDEKYVRDAIKNGYARRI